jgi:hypothetical protein
MAEFASNGGGDYPRTFHDGADNNSANFLTPYKLGTGTMRGVQDLGGDNVRIDSANRRIIISDDTNTRVIVGKLPDNTYGWAVSKPGSNVEDGFTS